MLHHQFYCNRQFKCLINASIKRWGFSAFLTLRQFSLITGVYKFCNLSEHRFEIFKYWKPVGVISVLDNDFCSIVSAGNLSANSLAACVDRSKPALVPIGRLDKASSGLLLLCRNPVVAVELVRTYGKNELCNKNNAGDKLDYGSRFVKTYRVMTRDRLSDKQLNRLRRGVEITTLGRRVGAKKIRRATLPCMIERTDSRFESQGDPQNSSHAEKNDDNAKSVSEAKQSTSILFFYLREGRNRQIRKMIGAVGHSVVYLHRVAFGDVTLAGLTGPGDMRSLSDDECCSLGIIK